MLSFWHIVVVVVVVALLFGHGRVSALMGDVAKGIKNFRKGLGDDASPAPPPATDARRAIDGPPVPGPQVDAAPPREPPPPGQRVG